mgnify:CR=1 FL=1
MNTLVLRCTAASVMCESETTSLVGKWAWLPVEDEDAYVLIQVKKHWQGQVFSQRLRAPKEVTKDAQLTDAEFAKLEPASDGDAEWGSVAQQADLVQLPNVTDAWMLHVLRARYEKELIFTWIGPVLLAVNPYKPVELCTADTLKQLSQQSSDELPPHVFSLAKTAYEGLIQEGLAQSVLISGESGAGKTETAKLTIRSIALLSHSSPAVAERALESGLLLEAFGNSKTIYNNNSSRFGKWCELHFEESGQMGACTMRTFLLEQSRVVSPPPGERNYHIFYHMLEGADEGLRAGLGLKPKNTDYTYTAAAAKSDGIDDAALWADAMRQLSMVGVSDHMVKSILELLAGVLTLGNIEFAAAKHGSDGGDQLEPKDPATLEAASRLLQMVPTSLSAALTTSTLTVAGSDVTKFLNDEDCRDTRDALSRTVYMTIFDHLVERINASLATGEQPEGERYIGILDVFGFENFRINYLEQLCINFANERLQQLFMECLIKRETAEYKREGLVCNHISYPDNGCVAAIRTAASRGLG